MAGVRADEGGWEGGRGRWKFLHFVLFFFGFGGHQARMGSLFVLPNAPGEIRPEAATSRAEPIRL